MTRISEEQLTNYMALNSQVLKYQARGVNENKSDSSTASNKQNVVKEQDSSKIDYDEYIEYCRQNAVAPDSNYGKTVVQKSDAYGTVQPLHIGRAMTTYAKADISVYQGRINSEV